MKRIPLTQGKFALVDDDDFARLSIYSWAAAKKPVRDVHYARRKRSVKECRQTGLKRLAFMHKEVLRVPDDLIVDHINRNPLDNRKANLRIATRSLNRANSRRIKANSGYKGVYMRGGRFWSKICVNQNNIYLGSFKDPCEAARTYDNAARHFFGEFAVINGV